MKKTGRCPNCSCTRMFVVDQVRQPEHDSSNTIIRMNVTTAAIHSAAVGLTDNNMYRAAIGSFEIWVCSACGLTEWYARDATEALELLAKYGDHGVRVVEHRDDGPFR